MEVGWTHKRRNMSILETVGSGRELMVVLRRQQKVFLVHIVTANSLKNLAVTGNITDTRSRKKPKKNYLDQIIEVIGGEPAQQLLNMT